MWHGAHIYDPGDGEEKTAVQMAWFIQRQDHPGEFLHIRGGRYIEWTKVREDSLQFFRAEDAKKFAEFFFGSTLHGHDIVAHGEVSA